MPTTWNSVSPYSSQGGMRNLIMLYIEKPSFGPQGVAFLPSPAFAFLFSLARSKEKVAPPGSRSRPFSCAVRSSQTISTTVEICMLTPADKMCVRPRSSMMLRCAKSRFRRPLRNSRWTAASAAVAAIRHLVSGAPEAGSGVRLFGKNLPPGRDLRKI